MSQKRPHIIAALIMLSGYTGCGEPSKPASAIVPHSAQLSPPASPAPSAAGAASSVLRFAQGSWSSDCNLLPFRQPYRTRLTFAGMTVTHESSVYQDSRCLQLISTWSRQLTITQVRREESPETGEVELNLGVRAGAVILTTFNGYGATANSLCGLSGWIDGAARNVSGLQCGPGRLEKTDRESTLTLRHDSDLGTLGFDDDLLRYQ